MKKQMIAALIATMLLTSCAAQGTQTDSAQTAEQAIPTATPEPAYEGPLYEVSYEKIQDTIPAFRNPNLGLGICGEHGGDPSSVEFCHNVGLDYVSCSPYRVPIARLAAAQAAIKNPRK